MSRHISRRKLGLSVIALLAAVAAGLALLERWAPAAAMTIVLVGFTSGQLLMTQSSVRALHRQAIRHQERLNHLRSEQKKVRDALSGGLTATREQTQRLQSRVDSTAARLEFTERRLTAGFESLRLAIEDRSALPEEATAIHLSQPSKKRSRS